MNVWVHAQKLLKVASYSYFKTLMGIQKCYIVIVVQSLNRVRLFAVPSFTISRSFPKLMSTVLAMLSNHFILCCPLLLPSIFPSIRVFSNKLGLFTSISQSIGASASVLPMNIQDWFPLGFTGLISLLSKGLWKILSSTTVQKHQFFSAQPSLWSNSHIYTWLLEKP